MLLGLYLGLSHGTRLAQGFGVVLELLGAHSLTRQEES